MLCSSLVIRQNFDAYRWVVYERRSLCSFSIWSTLFSYHLKWEKDRKRKHLKTLKPEIKVSVIWKSQKLWSVKANILVHTNPIERLHSSIEKLFHLWAYNVLKLHHEFFYNFLIKYISFSVFWVELVLLTHFSPVLHFI